MEFKIIIENLAKMYFVAKLLHWNASQNYADHLLYDRIAGDCMDSIDKVAEVCIFPFYTIDNLTFNFDGYGVQDLKNLIVETANLIQKLCEDALTAEGIKNTLSGIAESLNVKAYLLKDK